MSCAKERQREKGKSLLGFLLLLLLFHSRQRRALKKRETARLGRRQSTKVRKPIEIKSASNTAPSRYNNSSLTRPACGGRRKFNSYCEIQFAIAI